MMNRRRKFLSGFRIRSAILLWVVLVCLVSAGAAVPSPDAQGSAQQASPSPVRLKLGDAINVGPGIFRIPLSIDTQGTTIGAIQFPIVMVTDRDFLTLSYCTIGDVKYEGSILDCNFKYLGPSQGGGSGESVYQTDISLVTTSGISGSGTLVYLEFKYNTSFTGTKTVLCQIPDSSVDMFTLSGEKVNAWGDQNTYYIGAPDSSNAGDLNGDGKVTAVDALMALRMTTGNLAVNNAADLDKNGKVQVKDVLFILQKASMVGAAGSGGPGAGNRIGGVLSGPSAQEAEPREFTRMNLPNPDQGRPAVTLSTRTRDVDRSKTA